MIAVMLLLFTACEKRSPYTPLFEVGEAYTLKGDVISGTVIGNEYIPLFSVFTTEEDFIIFGDSSAETFLESGVIPLKAGHNRLVVRFYTDDAEREYELNLEYIPIRSLSVEVVDTEKTYHIGEKLDKNTIRVLAKTEDGKTVEVENYEMEYAFSELGEADVGIEVGEFYESFTVRVTEEYRPVLDKAQTADGVKYAIREGSAVLLSAEEMSGFFAVPSVVISDGKEYPVTELANGAFAHTKLEQVLIPEGVTKLSAGVFLDCSMLSEVELPSTVREIGRQAFSNCVSLDHVELPEGLTLLEYGIFFGCSSLFRVTLPEGLTEIGDMAFSGCEKLKLLGFPKTLKRIGSEAFADCKALKTVVLTNLEELGEKSFKNCENMTVFAVGNVKTLGNDIFEGTKTTIYTAENSAVFSYAKAEMLAVETVGEVPLLVSLPKRFAIEDGFPYHELTAFVCLGGTVSELTGYEVSYPVDRCGKLSLTVKWSDFIHTETLFVSYTETVLTDTDTRGARYELDTVSKTATLVSLPSYVKPSKVYHPEEEGLFLVPTSISCPDGEYEVVEVREGVMENCENVSKIFIPEI